MNKRVKPYGQITSLPHCFGCGVCSAVCPVEIIGFSADGEGFYRPWVKEADKCISCGRCVETCSYLAWEPDYRPSGPDAFSAWTIDSETRMNCSSGGVAFEIARQSLESDKTAVCAVRYDMTRHRAEHYVARDHASLQASRGSKYIQSFSAEGFKMILGEAANEKIVFGAPCQVASLHKHIEATGKRGRYLLVDFFCHGTPSLLLWSRYVRENGLDKAGADRITFRNKANGWQESYAVSAYIKNKEVYYSPIASGDLFFRFFLGNHALNLPCYTCPFRTVNSSADIRVGDMWGPKYSGNREGVSSVLVFTAKGRRTLGSLEGLVLHRETIEETVRGQIKSDLPVPNPRTKVVRALSRGEKLKYIYRRYVLTSRIKRMPAKAFRLIKFKLYGG